MGKYRIKRCDSIVTTHLNVENKITEEPPNSPEVKPVITQKIELKKGWNIFSTYVVPSNPDISVVLEVLKDNGQLFVVEDELGNTYEKGSGNDGWINNIGNLKLSEGYNIRVKSDCILNITGKQISLPMNIELHPGSNLISFPSNNPVNAMEIVQPLIDAGILEKVQDERGNSIELWETMGWINSIGDFIPGEGYVLQVNAEGILPIADTYQKSGFYFDDEMETSHFTADFEGNGLDHMNINIFGISETKLQIGDEIAAYDEKTCVGTIKLTETHFSDDLVSINASFTDENIVNGFIEGNTIKLKIWNYEVNKELDIQPDIILGNLIYQKHASVFVKLDEQNTAGLTNFNSIRIKLYPNPAREYVNFEFSDVPELGTIIRIFDLLGRQILIHEVRSNLEIVDIQSLLSGTYIVRTGSGDKYFTNKLVKE